MAVTLYERMGGEAALSAAVDIFYKKVIEDGRINGFFAGVDMAKQNRKMKSFLSYAFGANTPFTGKTMREGHAHLVKDGLNDSHFDAVKEHLQATLTELEVPSDMIEEVLGITETTRKDVLNN